MPTRLRFAAPLLLILAALAPPMPAAAFDFAGTKTVTLHDRAGKAWPVGSVEFRSAEGGPRFVVRLDARRFQDYFLSMKEFKCLESEAEVFCHVPYPYANPRTVGDGDLAWLEHDLLFFFKTPQDFGAKLWNGIYFRLQATPGALVGTPQAIDLNLIGVPPDDLSVAPYGPGERSEIDPARRWFTRLTIE